MSTNLPTPPSAAWLHLSNILQQWGNDTHADGGFPTREMELLRREGLLAVTLPGAALDMFQNHSCQLLQLLKLIGRGNLSVGRIYEGHINALRLIGLFGTAAQQERYFGDARRGHLFGVWNTEMHDGVHLHPTDGERYRVVGSKSFCSGSLDITRPIVPGRLHAADGSDNGWQMTVLRLDETPVPADPDFWHPMGMRNSVSHKLDFTGLLLAEDDLLGVPDDYHLQPYFSGGAIRFAAVHLGGAEALLDATREFLRRVGRTDNAHQRSRVGRMAILLESGNLWLERAGRTNDAQHDAATIVNYANMTRTAIADCCEQVLRLAGHCVGARGLLQPEIFGRLHTDLTTYLRQPAPDATLEAVGQYHLQNDTDFHEHRGC